MKCVPVMQPEIGSEIQQWELLDILQLQSPHVNLFTIHEL